MHIPIFINNWMLGRAPSEGGGLKPGRKTPVDDRPLLDMELMSLVQLLVQSGILEDE